MRVWSKRQRVEDSESEENEPLGALLVNSDGESSEGSSPPVTDSD